jgi:hypothetical protein
MFSEIRNAFLSWRKLLPYDDFHGFSNESEITDLVYVLKRLENAREGNLSICKVRCVNLASSMYLLQTSLVVSQNKGMKKRMARMKGNNKEDVIVSGRAKSYSSTLTPC